ncbi:hypothetical protein E6H16_00100 [Candidatus Bathyarchaeota archaeon]|nr:MAG: hypothetical protein E6H16_00100 [Candidatus Bathyarchaeota archaeon]
MGLQGDGTRSERSKDRGRARIMTEPEPAPEPGGEQKRRFRPRLYHLYPILFSFLVTGIMGYPIFLSRITITTPPVTYFPDNPIGAGLNALVFIATLTVSATGMLLLVRRRKKRALQGLVKTGLILMSFVVALWYGSSIASILNSPVSDAEILLISIGIAAVLAVLVYGKNKTFQAFGVTSVGASTGLFLGASIPLLTSLAILAALVVYDTVSVFRGPIGALARNVEVGDLTGAVFNYREISIGIAAVLAVLVYGKNKTFQAFGVTSVGASTGLFLGASIPLLTSLAILAALVVYDTVSVFRGPIGALARNVEVGDLTGAVFNYRDLTIGMGDIVFYSVVETVALLNFGIESFLAAGAGVIIGAYLGFRALSKYQVFPGLPFALLLGAGGMLAVALAQGLPI